MLHNVRDLIRNRLSFAFAFLTHLSLMTNTATLNTSNEQSRAKQNRTEEAMCEAMCRKNRILERENEWGKKMKKRLTRVTE